MFLGHQTINSNWHVSDIITEYTGQTQIKKDLNISQV